MKVDTHKSVGVYFLLYNKNGKDVKTWVRKERHIESSVKKKN